MRLYWLTILEMIVCWGVANRTGVCGAWMPFDAFGVLQVDCVGMRLLVGRGVCARVGVLCV